MFGLLALSHYLDDKHIIDINSIQNCDMNCQDKPNQTEYESCVGGCADKVLNKFPDDTDELLSKLKAI